MHSTLYALKRKLAKTTLGWKRYEKQVWHSSVIKLIFQALDIWKNVDRNFTNSKARWKHNINLLGKLDPNQSST
jgi:hypothetical protein